MQKSPSSSLDNLIEQLSGSSRPFPCYADVLQGRQSADRIFLLLFSPEVVLWEQGEGGGGGGRVGEGGGAWGEEKKDA